MKVIWGFELTTSLVLVLVFFSPSQHDETHEQLNHPEVRSSTGATPGKVSLRSASNYSLFQIPGLRQTHVQ